MASTSSVVITKKGEKVFRLGPRKPSVSVTSWKGKVYVYVREYEGNLHYIYPTAKGIALSPVEFERLMDFTDSISQEIRVHQQQQ